MSATTEAPEALRFDSHGGGSRNAPFRVYRQTPARRAAASNAVPLVRLRHLPWPTSRIRMITIFPDLSISMRAICTPAAVTALSARVTSCCRNVEGARAILSHSLSDAVAPHLHLQPRGDAMQGDAAGAV